MLKRNQDNKNNDQNTIEVDEQNKNTKDKTPKRVTINMYQYEYEALEKRRQHYKISLSAFIRKLCFDRKLVLPPSRDLRLIESQFSDLQRHLNILIAYFNSTSEPDSIDINFVRAKLQQFKDIYSETHTQLLRLLPSTDDDSLESTILQAVVDTVL